MPRRKFVVRPRTTQPSLTVKIQPSREPSMTRYSIPWPHVTSKHSNTSSPEELPSSAENAVFKELNSETRSGMGKSQLSAQIWWTCFCSSRMCSISEGINSLGHHSRRKQGYVASDNKYGISTEEMYSAILARWSGLLNIGITERQVMGIGVGRQVKRSQHRIR